MSEKRTKKEEEKKEEEPVKKRGLKQNKQMVWIVFLMVAIIVIILAVPIIKHEFFDKFRYSKLEFQKTITGDVIFYQTKIPIVDGKDITGSYSMQLRNDPRELEEIPADEKISEEGIKFIKSKTVYISIDPNMNKCDDNSVALFTLGSFLKDFGLGVKSAFTDEEFATEQFPYINCEHSKGNTVIKVTSGDETKIEKEFGNCYVITFKDCEIQKSVERFVLLILDDYMEYFERK
jgi:hypothetical protein